MRRWIGPLACGALFSYSKFLIGEGIDAVNVAAIPAIGGFAIGYADGIFNPIGDRQE